MPPKYVFNHIALYGDGLWGIYHKLDKKIPKTVECYGEPISSATELDDAISMALSVGVKRWDIQVIGGMIDD